MDRRKRSILQKVLLPVIALNIIGGGITTYANYHSARDKTEALWMENAQQTLNATNDSLNTFLDNTAASVNQLSNSPAIKNAAGDEQKAMELLTSVKENMPQVLNVYMALPNKKMLLVPAADLPADFDATKSSWYKSSAGEPTKMFWAPPYVDTATKKYTITATRGVLNNGKLPF